MTIPQDDSRPSAAERRELRGNESVVLDDPHAAWEVESGAIGVFAAVVHDGEPASAAND